MAKTSAMSPIDQPGEFRKRGIRRVAKGYIDSGHFASIEWLIKRHGKVMDAGVALPGETPSSLPDQPIYRIYSMTKPIVAAAGVILMERFRLHLFTPLGSILPEFQDMEVLNADGSAERAAPIMIEHLFTHRAGFSYNFMPDCPVGALYLSDGLVNDGGCTLETFANRAAQFPLAFQPGQRWHYSIANDILARVLEVVSGQALGTLLQNEIFDPLGMKDTQFFVPESERHRLMPMYGRSLDEILKAAEATAPLKKFDVDDAYPYDKPGVFARGGHGLFSTADDYIRFAQFTVNGKTPMGAPLVSRKMVDFMWHNRLSSEQLPYWLGPFPSPGYGFNLLGRVMLDPGQAISLTSEEEGGWGGAAATYYWVDRKEDFVGVVMTQNLGSLSPMRTDMMAAAYQALD
ncbi:MAG: serine hydrolase [Acidiferrobacteraceae bacterium]|nr:serine hydrolase [Acidiferrobacteraceae bacterium]MDP6398162.1 serine hydrolase domain-containing protein [Arenicellales bacterium]